MVDKFVLVEARHTHRGTPKPLFYRDHREDFDQWNSKIDSCIVDLSSIHGDTPQANGLREHAARKALDGYTFKQDSMIVYGDADEIVRPEVIASRRSSTALEWCEPRFYHYFYNCQEIPPPPGARPVIAPASVFKDIGFEDMRWVHGYSPSTTMPMIPDACWHFAYFGNAEALRYKIACAVEGAPSDWVSNTSLETLQSRIDAGRQYDNSTQYQFVSSIGLPTTVQRNWQALIKLGYVKEL